MKSPPFSGLVTPKELAPHVGLAVVTLQRKCRNGVVRVLPLGPPYFIPADEANRLTTAIANARHRNSIAGSSGDVQSIATRRNTSGTVAARENHGGKNGRGPGRSAGRGAGRGASAGAGAQRGKRAGASVAAAG